MIDGALIRRLLPGARGLAGLIATGFLLGLPQKSMAEPPPSSGRSPAETPFTVSIELRELPADGQFRVTYHLSQPAQGLRFERRQGARRRLSFRPLPPAGDGAAPFHWVGRGNDESLFTAPPDGRGRPPALSTFALEVAPDNATRAADYPMSVPFTDGSRLLFTGYLVALPLLCPAGVPCSPETARHYPGKIAVHWHFITDPGRRILVPGAGSLGQLEWDPENLTDFQGIFVYFGAIAPLAGEGFTAVVDPALPSWMVARTRAFLPRLFTFYRDALGIDLGFRPLVFLAYAPGASRELRFSGGTRGREMQFSATGQGWEDEGHESSPQWLRYLAHEAFHLWNGTLFRSRGDLHGEWLSEGSADFFALLALRRLGELGEEGFERAVVKATNRCLVGLRGRPLSALAGPQDFETAYPCGTTLLFLADRGLARRPPVTGGLAAVPLGVSDLFADLFERPDARFGHLGVADFLAVYRRLGGDPETIASLERVIDSGVAEGADAFFADALRRAGIAVERTPLAEGTLDPGAFLSLLTSLLARCDCSEAVPVAVGARSLTFSAHPGCRVFRQGFELTHVDGFPVPRQPAKAWADAVLRLGHGHPLSLRREGTAGTVSLSCPASRIDASYTTLLRTPPPRTAAIGAERDG